MASVASRNLFDLLGDSEEPETVVKEQEPAPAKETVVVKKVDRSRASPKEARIRFDYPQRGSYKSSASNRSDDTRSAPRDRNVGPRLSGRREEGGGDYPTRSSRGARPNDRGRGGRGGRRGREFDRHSGTGRFDSEKKEAQAWGNATTSYDTNESPGWSNDTAEKSGWNNDTTVTSSWGNDTPETTETPSWNENATDNNANSWNEVNTEEKSGWDIGTTNESDVWVQQPEVVEDDKAEQGEGTTTGETAQVNESEEVVKTFDEYLAEKAQKSLDITLPEARKPNEGTDDSQWKNAVPLEKEEEDDFLFTGKEQSYRLKNKKSKSKNYLEIEPTFIERPGGGLPRGRGRGGRGRGGRGGRDDGRSHRDNYDNDNRDNRRRGGGGRSGYVNLDDQRAFPSLGA